MPPKRPMLDPTTIPVSEREGNQLAWSMKEFEHYGDVTTKTPCRFCGFEFKGSVADFEDFDYDVLPWDIEMVIAEPDAVVDDNPVVAAADAADLRDLQGPDYFENVAQEQQGPTRRQRRQPARFRDDPTGLLDN